MPDQQKFEQLNFEQQINQPHTEILHKDVRDDPYEHKGVMDKIKDGVEKVYEKVTGKDDDVQYQLRKDFKKADKRAEELTKEGRKELDHNKKDIKKAEKLQHKAAKIADKANRATEYALDKQVEGQDKLATAGYKKMEAGAKLQAQANQSGTDRQIPHNVHNCDNIRQHTSTTGCEQTMGRQEETIIRETRPGQCQ